LKIDVDKNQAIAQRLQVRNVPTIALYKNGNQLFRQAGVLQVDQLIWLVKEHI
jgi:thioredoxin 1